MQPTLTYVSSDFVQVLDQTVFTLEAGCSVGLSLGVEYEKKKQRLQNELRMEYRRYMAQKQHLEPVKPRPFIHLNNCISVEKDPLEDATHRPLSQRDGTMLTDERSLSHRPLRLLHPEEEDRFRKELEPTGGRRSRQMGAEISSERRRTADVQTCREMRGNSSCAAGDGRRLKALSINEEPEFATSLIIGAADTDEVVRRRKDLYRKELLDQIAEQQRNKKREKDLELKVAATGANDPEKQVDRIGQLSLRRRKDGHVSEPIVTLEGATSALCQPPPCSQKLVVRQREIPPLDPPHAAFQSPLLDYSAALGLGAPGGLGGGRMSSNCHPAAPSFPAVLDFHRNPSFAPHPPSSLSEAYRHPYAEPHHYYGARNLLDPNAAYGHCSVPGVPGVPGVGLPMSYWTAVPGAAGPSQFGTHSSHSRLSGSSFPEPQSLLNADAVIQFPPSDFPQSRRESHQSYRDALQQQIQEQRELRRQEREEKERLEAQLEADMKTYQPWGRGGGGAPLRDSTGNLITDLRQMHNLNEQAYSNLMQSRATADPAAPRTETDPNDRVSGFTQFQSSRFARGKVFPEQPTEQQLHELDRLRAALKQQIEEKTRRRVEERERERLEEEKEEKRLAEQRARMQREYEEEQEKKKRKEMEQNAKNEELMQLAQKEKEKKKEMERKKKEAEEKEKEALREQDERERQARVEQICRPPSPPIPVVQKRQQQQQYTPTPPTVDSRLSESSLPGLQSPPVPALRNRLRAAGKHDNLMGELARLRQHLCNQQKVLEKRLQQEESEELQSPLSDSHGERSTMDVFEMARRRLQVPVRKPSPRHIEPHKLTRIHDSLQLRYSDAESRLEDENRSGRKRQDFTELHQQARSRRSTVQDDYSDLSPPQQRNALRSDSGSARGYLLESESTFIDPLEALSLPQTPEVEKNGFLSARERRRLNKQSQQERASSGRPSVHTGSRLQQELEPLSDWLSWSRGHRPAALGRRGNTSVPAELSNDDSPSPCFSVHGLNRQSSAETVDLDIWTRPESSDTFKSFK